jgi:AcrR family transcriptional regulator
MSSNQASRARVGLERDAIIDTALDLMDQHGVDGVSMRRLAAELNVTATALYWHVGSKEGLWSAALDRVLDRIVVEDDPELAWQVRVRRFLSQARRQLLAHPSSLELSLRVGPPVVSRWRPITFDMMVAAGFDGQDAVDYARLVAWQATGYARMEHNADSTAYVTRTIDPATGTVVKHVPASAEPDQSGLEAAGYDPTAHYDLMIDVFVAGLEALATRRDHDN